MQLEEVRLDPCPAWCEHWPSAHLRASVTCSVVLSKYTSLPVLLHYSSLVSSLPSSPSQHSTFSENQLESGPGGTETKWV